MEPEQCYPYDELINEYCPEFMQLIDSVELVTGYSIALFLTAFLCRWLLKEPE